MNLTYPHMDKSEEERHVSPNASHGNYIVVHTGSTYRESTVVVRSELKPRIRKHKDRHCYDSSVPYVYVVDWDDGLANRPSSFWPSSRPIYMTTPAIANMPTVLFVVLRRLNTLFFLKKKDNPGTVPNTYNLEKGFQLHYKNLSSCYKSKKKSQIQPLAIHQFHTPSSPATDLDKELLEVIPLFKKAFCFFNWKYLTKYGGRRGARTKA